MNKKNKLILGVAIIAVLVGYLLFSSGVATNQYEVSQAVVEKANLTGKIIVVNGSMVAGSDHWDALNRTLTFNLTDGKATIGVIYTGEKPNLPPEATDVQAVVTGQFSNNVFEAFRMMTKCPDKYAGENPVVPTATVTP